MSPWWVGATLRRASASLDPPYTAMRLPLSLGVGKRRLVRKVVASELRQVVRKHKHRVPVVVAALFNDEHDGAPVHGLPPDDVLAIPIRVRKDPVGLELGTRP